MATIEELNSALIKADAAGDAAGAKLLADHIRSVQSQATPDTHEPRGWGDTLASAVTNIPSSAINMAKGIGEAVLHPIDTAKSIGSLAGGEVGLAFPRATEAFTNLVGTGDEQRKANEVARNFNEVYRKGYGSSEGFKERLATDPLAVVGDVSTLLTGGAGAVGKLGAVAGSTKAAKIGEILAQAGSATNPLSAVPAVARGVGAATDLAGSGVANVLGHPLLTGVGGDTVRTAFNAGKTGSSGFMDSLRGKTDMEDILGSAKQNLQTMAEKKSLAYKTGMADVSKDMSILKFDGIDDAVKNATGKATYGGQIVNQKAFKSVQDAKDAIDQWKSGDPAIFATPEGMDKLKQRIGAIQESIPFEEKTARAAVGEIYNSVKGEISKQAPTYAKTMGEYSTASKQIDEIRKALSLGENASADTALRKLQSLTRNNVTSNYGHRADLAKALIDQGGRDIMPALAGQAMNSWIGRGLGSHIGQAAGVASGAFNPALLPALAFTSPKIVGAGAYGLGSAVGAPGRIAGKIPFAAPSAQNIDRAKALALLLQQSQQGND